jgi:nicotinamide-nucleotide amidase
MLGIDPAILEKHGAVSRETALAMAEGALKESGADIAASVTGLAGPEGDASLRPVGTVFIAGICRAGGPAETREYHFSGSRNGIRRAAAGELIALLLRMTTLSPRGRVARTVQSNGEQRSAFAGETGTAAPPG